MIRNKIQKIGRLIKRNLANMLIILIVISILMPIAMKDQEKNIRREKEVLESIILEEQSSTAVKVEEVETALQSVVEAVKMTQKGLAQAQEVAETKKAEEKKKKKKKSKAKKMKATKTVSKEQKGYPELQGQELDMAIAIFKEAQYGNFIDHVAVACVIANRCTTKYKSFRNVKTVRQVLKQEGQYWSGTIQAVEAGIEPSEMALEVAHGIISGEIPCLDERILYQTTTKQSWMVGKLIDANIPGVAQYYGIPIDYEEGCK